MKKRICLFLLFFLIAALVAGCKYKTNRNTVLPEGSYKVYYINSSQTGIVWEAYKAESTAPEALIEELLEQLSSDSGNYAYKHSISDDVIVKEFTLTEGNLTINFDSTYQNQNAIDEALMRAAIVKTLTQIEGVDYVEFYVNGAPLIDAYEKVVSPMTAEDFIDDNDVESSYIPASLYLYFSNEKGDKLVEAIEKKLYDGSITMEQLILLRLIEGPDEAEMAEGMKAVIPKDTVLNNVTTKEGVCYVDFSKEFLNPMEGIDEMVSIYAVVNSLVELNNINKVQIMIDGKIVDTYRDSVELDVIFERNLNIVEGTR